MSDGWFKFKSVYEHFDDLKPLYNERLVKLKLWILEERRNRANFTVQDGLRSPLHCLTRLYIHFFKLADGSLMYTWSQMKTGYRAQPT